VHGWLEVKDGRRRDRMQKAFTETLVPCVRINGLSLFAKLELGSLGGFAFFVGFPNGFFFFFLRVPILPVGDFDWCKKTGSQ